MSIPHTHKTPSVPMSELLEFTKYMNSKKDLMLLMVELWGKLLKKGAEFCQSLKVLATTPSLYSIPLLTQNPSYSEIAGLGT